MAQGSKFLLIFLVLTTTGGVAFASDQPVQKKDVPAASSGDHKKSTEDQKDTVSSAEHKENTADQKDGALPAPKKTPSPWAGTNAQLGYIVNTGNTNATSLNAGLNLVYTQPKWTNAFQFTAYLNKSKGVVSKEQYFVTNQWSYYLGSTRSNYLFFNGRFMDDRFSPYEYQSVFATGYGHDIIKTDRFTLSAQAGPGLRHNSIRNDDGTHQVEDNVILTTATTAKWQATKNLALSEQLNYDTGKPYDYAKSVTALTDSLGGHLAMQLSYTVEYYSKIPRFSVNTKKTDTITNIALVYNF